MTDFFLQYFSVTSTVLVSIVVVFLWSRYGFFENSLIYLYFLASGITEIVVAVLSYNAVTNIELLNYFFVFEFISLYFSLIYWLQTGRRIQFFLSVFGVIVSSVSIYYQLYFTNSIKFNVIASTIFSVILIFTSINYILKASREDYQVFSSEKFWYACSVFIHFTLAMILMATSELTLDGGNPIRKNSWTIYLIINILSNFVYLKGLACIHRRMKNYSLH